MSVGRAETVTRIAVPTSLYPEGYDTNVVGGNVTSKAGEALMRVAAASQNAEDVIVTVQPAR